MRALYYPDWDRLEIREVDRPKPGSGEVLIRVAACGVCGSEIESVLHHSPRRTPPLILGHEFCGVIEEISDDVGNDFPFECGSQVVPNAVLHCGTCRPCKTGAPNLCEQRAVFGMHRQGAFAEFVTAPASSLFPWPSNVPAEAACLAEPLGNGIHVANLVQRFDPHSVIIIGAGSIGLMCLQAVRSRFPEAVCVVTDLDDTRLDVARQLGAADAIPPTGEVVRSAMRRVLGSTEADFGADVVIDAAGVGITKQRSLEWCRPGGAVVWIGLGENAVSIDSYQVTLAERAILGSYGATASDMQEALRLMAENFVDVSTWVTHYPAADWVEGFTRQLEVSTRDVKAVLTN